VIGCSEGTSRQVGANILALSGECVLRSGAVNRQLDVDTHPRAGDVLETGARAQISAALLPNVLVEIQPNSALQIEALSLAKDGNDTIEPMRARVVHVQLLHGSMTVSQRRLDVAAEPSLRIATPHGAAISSYDCLFSIEIDSSRTRVACEEGYVYLAAKEHPEPVQVEPGFTGEIDSAHSVVALRSADMTHEQTLESLGSTESRLTQLLAAEKQAPPPWLR